MMIPPDIRERVLADPDLGKISDKLIAGDFKIAPELVKQIRLDAGIRRYKKRRSRSLPPRVRRKYPLKGPGLDALKAEIRAAHEAGVLDPLWVRDAAMRIGVGKQRIDQIRRSLGFRFKRGIVPGSLFHKRYPRVVADPDLGKITDQEVAHRHGLNRLIVGRVRRSLGIAPAPRDASTEPARGPIATDPDLGRVTDQEIGERYGVTRTRVQQVRAALGIPACGERRVSRSQAACLADPDLGKVPDALVGKRHGLSRSRVGGLRRARGLVSIVTSAKPGLRDQIAALHREGESNTAIAAKVGTSIAYVGRVLREDVPDYVPASGARLAPIMDRVREQPDYATAPASVIAKRLGCAVSTVRTARVRDRSKTTDD